MERQLCAYRGGGVKRMEGCEIGSGGVREGAREEETEAGRHRKKNLNETM